MRTSARCPKCSGTRLMVTELRSLVPAGTASSHVPVPALVLRIKRLLGFETRALGRYEAWTCADCGFTELYAEDLGAVDIGDVASKHPEDLRIVEGTPPRKRPFR